MSGENHRPAGVPDRSAVQTSIREASQKAQELRRQAEAARASLTEAAAKVQDLEQQAAAAQKVITQYQEQESVIARALQDAQRMSEDLARSAKGRAEEVIAAAKSAAEGIAQSARATAADTLQKARESAQEQLQAAERATAVAKAAADEIMQTARATAADTLQKARESAQEQLQAAERASAGHLARLRAESDQVVAESHRKVREVQQSAEQYLGGVTAKLDAFVRDREAVSRGLDALAKNHTESIQEMMRLRSEVQSQILPAVHRLLRKLKGEDVGEADTDTPVPAAQAPVPAAEPPAAHAAATAHGAPAIAARGTPATAAQGTSATAAQGTSATAAQRAPVGAAQGAPARAAAAPATPEEPAKEPAEASVPATRYNGQIVVSPIHSFLQATKFMTALSQVKGVASVKLRTYSGAKATIETVTEGYTVAGIDYKAIDAFPVEVVESNDTQIVLRIASPAARPVTG